MKRVFSAWGNVGDAQPSTLIGGVGPPAFADGTSMPECEKLFFRIEAANWEEAMAIFHLRMGRSPYKPVLPVENCPNCGVLFYPQGSGQCWNCEFTC